jgi:SAM-dependent methyltransferase
MNNIQSFSVQSGAYASHRPAYPRELFVYLSSLADQHAAAWDCATGSGQAASGCAEFFTRVEASDISLEQVRHSLPHPRVTYCVSPAERAPFAEKTFDLVVAAQAAHWFNLEAFYAEALRVLKPGGVLAVWGYGLFSITPEIDEIITRDLFEPIDPFWAEGNRQLMAGYRNLVFPLAEMADAPRFEMRMNWTRSQLLDYLGTWSATKRHVAELGRDPLLRLEESLPAAWGPDGVVRTVKMPVFLRVGKT